MKVNKINGRCSGIGGKPERMGHRERERHGETEREQTNTQTTKQLEKKDNKSAFLRSQSYRR